MVDIIYEDNQLVVAVKPQNMPTQEDITKDMDMLSSVKQFVKEKYNKPGNVFIGLVHRLDRPTGGIMVFARNSKSAARLSEQIREHTLIKKYYCVVLGIMKIKEDRVVNYVKKNEKDNIVTLVPMSEEGAKKAELIYKVVAETKTLSLVEVQILTGRSHQIRVQLANLGYPIFGDAKYGGDKYGKSNLALWASSLDFVHPTTKANLHFKCNPPELTPPWDMFDFSKIGN